MSWFYLPFLFQGILMFVDEFYFHEQRELPRWERIGHPLDTLTTFVTLSVPAFFPYSGGGKFVYFVFAILSCLFITKDEFIHNDLCSKGEQWIHSLLFILHPILFGVTYLMWMNSVSPIFLIAQFIIVGVFMIYQIFRWNIYEPKITN